MYAARIYPAIVEIEQGAGGDREIDRFVVPAGGVERFHVIRCDPGRIVVNFVDETKQRLVFVVEAGVFEVSQHAPHQFFAAQ